VSAVAAVPAATGSAPLSEKRPNRSGSDAFVRSDFFAEFFCIFDFAEDAAPVSERPPSLSSSLAGEVVGRRRNVNGFAFAAGRNNLSLFVFQFSPYFLIFVRI